MTMHPIQSTRALLILGILSSPIPVLGDEPTADESAEVTLQFLKPCDALNRRLYLENKHTYRTYAVTVHWNAAGGKELSERLIISPNSMQEVGCAANARIVDALPMEF